MLQDQELLNMFRGEAPTETRTLLLIHRQWNSFFCLALQLMVSAASCLVRTDSFRVGAASFLVSTVIFWLAQLALALVLPTTVDPHRVVVFPQHTIRPSRTTRVSMTGTCGSRCTKEASPCRCSRAWRPSGPACRYSTPGPSGRAANRAFIRSSVFQSLLGNLDSAARTFQNYYSVWRQFGGLPEFYSITQGYTVDKREGYPLRPELMESAMYLFRATGDHTYLQFGLDAVESIERIAKTPCGYASVKDLRDHQLDNRMESFFLAETIKYLYLLFDPSHFLHGGGMEGDGSWEGGGASGQCVLGAGGFIFNTEAHPLDPAALHCCSRHAQERRELQHLLLGLTVPAGQSERPAGQSERPAGQSERPAGQSERPAGQSEQPAAQTEDPPPSQSESIALKPGEKKAPPPLSCPVQPFGARLAILGQVFSDDT
uniref:alpha-1,2-Mannosidase n=1 Tax=Poecilia mexicana TaxID=48701 RepID=A0A3B3YEC3_9TELE